VSCDASLTALPHIIATDNADADVKLGTSTVRHILRALSERADTSKVEMMVGEPLMRAQGGFTRGGLKDARNIEIMHNGMPMKLSDAVDLLSDDNPIWKVVAPLVAQDPFHSLQRLRKPLPLCATCR
jgi:hypothetical protein